MSLEVGNRHTTVSLVFNGKIIEMIFEGSFYNILQGNKYASLTYTDVD